MLKRQITVGLVVLAGSLPSVTRAVSPEPSGKIVYEDHFIKDWGKHPGIVVFDLATRSHTMIAAPGFRPRWLPSGREIAYFLPDKLSNGLVEISSPVGLLEHRLTSDWISTYAAILPGHSVIVGLDGVPRRELQHFVADIDSTGRLALTVRPRSAPAVTPRRSSGDILSQDVDTGVLSMLLAAEQIGDEQDETLRDARWFADGRSVVYRTESFRRNESGNWVATWALYLADTKTGKRSKLAIAGSLPFQNNGPYDFGPSRDGNTIAFSVIGNKDLWSFDVAKAISTKIEMGERSYRKGNPVYSSDGRFILFELTDQTDAYGTTSFWVGPAGGGSANRVLPRSWRHAIRFLVLQEKNQSADWWQAP